MLNQKMAKKHLKYVFLSFQRIYKLLHERFTFCMNIKKIMIFILFYIFSIVLMFIFILIYMALKNLKYTLIIFLTLPFALSGGVFYIEYLGFNISIAVIVGFMALLGVAAETSIVMMLYLDEAYKNIKEKTNIALKEAIYHGAVLRLRPKLMTLFAILGGLIPIMYINSIGSEVMQRVAAPMIGGMLSSTILTLIIIPAIFYLVILKKDKIID